MDIKKQCDDRTLTVTLVGELNTLSAPELEQAVKDDLKSIDTIIFDMTDLTYITSAGLRILLVAQQELDDRGGVIICGLRPEIREVIEITGFDTILTIE